MRFHEIKENGNLMHFILNLIGIFMKFNCISIESLIHIARSFVPDSHGK